MAFTSECPFTKNVSCSPLNVTIPSSCHERCFKTNRQSPRLECMCDHACMFLGDCCYDYLLKCDPSKLDIARGLREQYSVFKHFDRYSSCVLLGQLKNADDLKHMKLVNTCPDGIDHGSMVASMCSDPLGKRTISTCMSVESDGVLYRNMYCAACHGRALHQLHAIASYGFGCSDIFEEIYDARLWPFVNDFNCELCELTLEPKFKYIARYEDACWCEQALPYRSCKKPMYEMECNAYSMVIYDTFHQSYNKEPCKICDSVTVVNLSRHESCNKRRTVLRHLKIFDFTGKSFTTVHICKEYLNIGQSGNPCLVKHCQTAFEVHDDMCISVKTAQVCYPSEQNRHHSNFLIANLFRSAMIIHYKASISRESLFSQPVHRKIEKTTPCSHIPKLYKGRLPHNLVASSQCAVLYFDSVAFANFSGDLSTGDLSKELFPDIEVLHIMVLNHDPIDGISCSGGVRLEHLAHMQVLTGGIVQCRSRNSKESFTSNRDPLAVIYQRYVPGVELLAFICRPVVQNENCSSLLEQENSSPMGSCLKYELTDNNTLEDGTLMLKSGKILEHGQFMYTDKGTILVCADIYDKLHEIVSYTWVIIVSVSYTISLMCLMATIIIYIRYRELRTLPGLMLMNLIVALFFAQFFFLLNVWGLSETDPILCVVMATAQHYFWLASFAWMGCISLDIFHSFSPACTTVNTYSRSKYYKCMVAGWVSSLPFPIVTDVLTLSTSSNLGYSTTGSCWIASPRGILYFFGIPVLAAVGTNVLLFTGSLYRLNTLMKNASFVGRKEEGKQRLAQCIRLSSLMGVSWLFGIIPNVVGIDTLWYVFVATNALQGVHIFLAFGCTRKVRALIRENFDKNAASATASSAVLGVTTNMKDS